MLSEIWARFYRGPSSNVSHAHSQRHHRSKEKVRLFWNPNHREWSHGWQTCRSCHTARHRFPVRGSTQNLCLTGMPDLLDHLWWWIFYMPIESQRDSMSFVLSNGKHRLCHKSRARWVCVSIKSAQTVGGLISVSYSHTPKAESRLLSLYYNQSLLQIQHRWS